MLKLLAPKKIKSVKKVSNQLSGNGTESRRIALERELTLTQPGRTYDMQKIIRQEENEAQ